MRRFIPYCTTAVLLTLATVFVPASANAGLCATCVGKAFVQNVGKCANCGVGTTSGSFQLCQACSTKLNQCQVCRVALSAGSTNLPPVAPPVIQPVVKPTVDPVVKPTVDPVVPPVAAVPISKDKPVEQPKAVAPAPSAVK